MPARLDPAVAAQVMRDAGLEPLEPYRGCQKAWRCKCLKCGREVSPQYANIRQGQGGCVGCARILESEAVQKMRAAGFEPQEPYPDIRAPWSCRCTTCGKTTSPSLARVLYAKGGCKWCSARVPLDAAAAEDVMRQAGLIPLVPYPGSSEPWPCRCARCGLGVSPQYGVVRARKSGCRRCGSRAGGDTRRLDASVAAQTMIEAGLQPLDPYPGSNFPWRCRCMTCNAEVHPIRNNVNAGSGGCRFCARRGFDATKPAVVYLVAHQTLGAIKVGIGNVDAGRLAQHRKRGWESVAVIRTPGANAKRVERAILRWWRKDLGLPSYLDPQDMPQDGWTETAELDAVDVPETIRRIEKLAAAG